MLVVAEDNDTYRPEPPADASAPPPPPPPEPPTPRVESILMCGWRRDIRDVLLLLDGQVARGTEVHMVTDALPLSERGRRLRAEGLDASKDLANLRVVHKGGNTSVRRHLEVPRVEPV